MHMYLKVFFWFILFDSSFLLIGTNKMECHSNTSQHYQINILHAMILRYIRFIILLNVDLYSASLMLNESFVYHWVLFFTFAKRKMSVYHMNETENTWWQMANKSIARKKHEKKQSTNGKITKQKKTENSRKKQNRNIFFPTINDWLKVNFSSFLTRNRTFFLSFYFCRFFLGYIENFCQWTKNKRKNIKFRFNIIVRFIAINENYYLIRVNWCFSFVLLLH